MYMQEDWCLDTDVTVSFYAGHMFFDDYAYLYFKQFELICLQNIPSNITYLSS